ncbi:MAG: hypothetical protein J7L55_05800 [Desulfurococcales archaeon]|nr:hypothetical protein [Desulfurococcales archaeon]
MAFKDYLTPAVGVALIAFSLYVFYVGIALMMGRDVPSSLLSVLIGFTTLGGGVTLLRAWALSRACVKGDEETR